MYRSRNVFNSKGVSISFDVQNGEILAIFDEKSKDNIIKNHVYHAPNLFCIYHNNRTISIPDKMIAGKDSDLKPIYEDYGDYCTLTFKKLHDGEREYDISVKITVTSSDRGLSFKGEIINNSDISIDAFEYPCINGIIIGENYSLNTFVYPFNAGIKMKNPVEYFEKPSSSINWRWQDYKYYYSSDGFSKAQDANGFYSFSMFYSGPVSLRYYDLSSKDYGVFFGLPEKDGLSVLIVRTKGTKCAGMTFSVKKQIEGMNEFETKSVLLQFHDGDWHKSAEIYRNLTAKEHLLKSTPKWFAEAGRLTAHYDFQYQNGGIVHTFTDIPKIADEAVESGSKHLLLSGWHTGGFDNGFPDYSPNPILGTDEDFKAGLDYAHSKGVRVSLYINTRMANTLMDASENLIKTSAVINKHGNNIHEHAGNGDIDFVLLCPSSEEWRNHLLKHVTYLAKLGIDGVYYDQLAMAAPCPCYDTRHNHLPFDWMEGYVILLQETKRLTANSGEHLNIIIEGCSDFYNPYADGMLVSTFSYINGGAFPELYRYTCPEQKLVDMVYPRYKNAMRPEFVSARSTYMINKCFTTDMTCWVYDLEEDNTFKTDPEQAEYLYGIVKLRESINEELRGMKFCDDRGLSGIPDGMDAKVYRNENGGIILYTNETEETVDLIIENEIKVEKIICDKGEYNEKLHLVSQGKTFLYIPESNYGALIFKL